MQAIRTLSIVIAASCSTATSGAEIAKLTVAKKGRAFVSEAEFVIDLPHERVVSAFTAFDRLTELNPAVVESKAEMQSNGNIRVTTRLRDCVVFFCRSVEMVEDVYIDDSDGVRAQIVPDLGDFESGQTTWRFDDLGRQTRVRYESRVTPNFWLPPLLGSTAIRWALKRQISVTASNLETIGAAGE